MTKQYTSKYDNLHKKRSTYQVDPLKRQASLDIATRVWFDNPEIKGISTEVLGALIAVYSIDKGMALTTMGGLAYVARMSTPATRKALARLIDLGIVEVYPKAGKYNNAWLTGYGVPRDLVCARDLAWAEYLREAGGGRKAYDEVILKAPKGAYRLSPNVLKIIYKSITDEKQVERRKETRKVLAEEVHEDDQI